MRSHALYCGSILVLLGLLPTVSTADTAGKSARQDTFVRVSPRDSRYLELTDGTPYVPIGFNLVDAPPEKDWPDVLGTMAAHNLNYCRVFLDVPPWRVEQRKSGQYNTDHAEVLVRFLEAAGRRGIRVKACLEHFRDVQPQPADAPPPKDHWSQRPYHHRDNGGPFASMEDYLNSEAGIAQCRRKLAFYQTHCGDRPEVFAWELWNEMNCVKGDWLTWTKRMLPEVHRLFPKNLVVQSMGSFDTPKKRDSDYRPTVTLAGNDVAQVHRYLDLGASWEICHGPVDVMLADAVGELRAMAPDKPILVAETGAVKPKHTGCSELYEKDKAGMILHDVLFAPFFAGAAGPGHTWWWRQSVQQPNLWHHFDRFAAVIEGIDVPAERFEPLRVPHPRLRVYVLKGRTALLAWCRDSRNDWRSELEAGNAPEVVNGLVLDLGGQLPKHVADIRIYDPWKNEWTGAKISSRKIALPAFERSIFVRVRYPEDVHDTIVSEPAKDGTRGDVRALTTASGAAETDDEANLRAVRPEASTAPLLNPGKGWALYDMPEAHRGGSRPYGAIGYKRFQWCEIEPQEGQYNWKPIDDFMAAWKKEGLPVAFGVMTANIHYRGMYVTPKWVFDAGCQPRTVQQKRPEAAKDVAAFYQYEGPQVIPADWLDPVYLAKLEAFLTALARRYEGRPELAWYEIRAYGNWGEGHLWPWRGEEPTPEQLFQHYILLHRRLFPKSVLMANETYFRGKDLHLRAARIGVGVRDDGVMSFRDGSTTAECDGLAPSCFEWGCSYAQAVREGLLTREGRSLEDCIRNGHVYYCGFARGGVEDIKAFAQNEKPLIDRLTNLMGYHLVIDEAMLPKGITSGEEFPLTLTWRNAGVARMWFPCSVAVALLDGKEQVVARTWLDGSQPGACPGGQRKTEYLKAGLAKVPAGNYRLAVGLFRDRLANQPEVKLGLKDITADNWHPLAEVVVDARPIP